MTARAITVNTFFYCNAQRPVALGSESEIKLRERRMQSNANLCQGIDEPTMNMVSCY